VDAWVLEEVFREHSYEPPPTIASWIEDLGRPLRVADLGGHVGIFGLFSLDRFPVAGITSFEPDPANLTCLRGCVRANRLEDTWTVVPAAAATADGALDFVSSRHLSHAAHAPAAIGPAGLVDLFPFLAGGELVEARNLRVEARDCLPVLHGADLIKIDIEGAEWPLLADGRLSELGPAALVVECHRSSSPEPDAVAHASSLLDSAGFGIVSAREPSGEAALIWALKPG
jgi:FkbM family methyltransferase